MKFHFERVMKNLTTFNLRKNKYVSMVNITFLIPTSHVMRTSLRGQGTSIMRYNISCGVFHKLLWSFVTTSKH